VGLCADDAAPLRQKSLKTCCRATESERGRSDFNGLRCEYVGVWVWAAGESVGGEGLESGKMRIFGLFARGLVLLVVGGDG
jgi:hypothetical protein